MCKDVYSGKKKSKRREYLLSVKWSSCLWDRLKYYTSIKEDEGKYASGLDSDE